MVSLHIGQKAPLISFQTRMSHMYGSIQPLLAFCCCSTSNQSSTVHLLQLPTDRQISLFESQTVNIGL